MCAVETYGLLVQHPYKYIWLLVVLLLLLLIVVLLLLFLNGRENERTSDQEHSYHFSHITWIWMACHAVLQMIRAFFSLYLLHHSLYPIYIHDYTFPQLPPTIWVDGKHTHTYSLIYSLIWSGLAQHDKSPGIDCTYGVDSRYFSHRGVIWCPKL